MMKTAAGKGIRPLIANELIKITKQISVRIFLIIFAALLIIVPLATRGLDLIINRISFTEDYDSYLELISLYEENGDFSGAAFYKGRYESYAYFRDLGLGNRSVEASVYLDSLRELYSARDAVDYIYAGRCTYGKLRENDWGQIRIINECYAEAYGLPDETEPEGPGTGEGTGVPDLTEDKYGYVENADLSDYITPEVLVRIYSDISSRISEIENRVRNFDIRVYYSDLVSDEEEYYASEKERLQSVEDALKTSPKDKELLYSREVLKRSLEQKDSVIFALTRLRDSGSEFGGWEYKTAMAVCAASKSIPGDVPVDSETFETEPNLSLGFKDYKKYTEALAESEKQAVAARDTGLYSLRRGVVSRDTVEDSSRAAFQSHLSIAVSLSALIVTVIAGTSVASEHGSGTIRLLLIRPRKRTAILASKILAILIVWGAMLAAAFAVTFVMDALLHGFGDLFRSDLYYAFGRPFGVVFILSDIALLFIDVLSLLPAVSLAFMLSVAVRKTPLAIALPLILNYFMSAMQMICFVAYSEGIKFIAYTPLPYSDLSVFTGTPLDRFIQGGGTGISGITTGALAKEILGGTVSGSDFSLVTGIIWMSAITAVFAVLSFGIFKKQQIKS